MSFIAKPEILFSIGDISGYKFQIIHIISKLAEAVLRLDLDSTGKITSELIFSYSRTKPSRPVLSGSKLKKKIVFTFMMNYYCQKVYIIF